MNNADYDEVQTFPASVRSALNGLMVMVLISAVLAFFLAPYL